ARPQLHLAVSQRCQCSPAIPFDLEEPVRAGKGSVGEARQRHANILRHGSFARTRRHFALRVFLRWRWSSFLSVLLFREDHSRRRISRAANRRRVGVLDQQPFPARLASSQLHQHETSVQFLAMQDEFQFATAKLLARRSLPYRLERAFVPNSYFARPVVSGRNRAVETSVLERMVFGLHRQPFVGRIERRAFWNGPRFQDPVDLETEIVVQPPGVMFLDDKPVPAASALLSPRFGSFLKFPLSPVFAERRHGRIINSAEARKRTINARTASNVGR